LWAEATLTASYVLNRSAKSSVEGKTPYELWHGRKGATEHLRIFGTECIVHVPKVRRKKCDAKSVKGVMIGYSGQKDGYRVWIPGNNTAVMLSLGLGLVTFGLGLGLDLAMFGLGLEVLGVV